MESLLGGIALLQSKPGCLAQLPHADYNISGLVEARNQGMSEKNCPLGAMFGFQDFTLDIWPEALLLKKSDKVFLRKVVPIKEGQLLLFRGDLVHAGSHYASLNHRLHFYLDSPLCSRASNSTQYITSGSYVNINDK